MCVALHRVYELFKVMIMIIIYEWRLLKVGTIIYVVLSQYNALPINKESFPSFDISVKCAYTAYNVCVDVCAYVCQLAGMFYMFLSVTRCAT